MKMGKTADGKDVHKRRDGTQMWRKAEAASCWTDLLHSTRMLAAKDSGKIWITSSVQLEIIIIYQQRKFYSYPNES